MSVNVAYASFRISPVLQKILTEHAARTGLSESAVIRGLIRRHLGADTPNICEFSLMRPAFPVSE